MKNICKKFLIICCFLSLITTLSGCVQNAGYLDLVAEMKDNFSCLYLTEGELSTDKSRAVSSNMLATYARKVKQYEKELDKVDATGASKIEIKDYKSYMEAIRDKGFNPYFEGKHKANPTVTQQINNNISWILSPTSIIKLLNWFSYAVISNESKTTYEHDLHQAYEDSNGKDDGSKVSVTVTGNWWSSYGATINHTNGQVSVSQQKETNFPQPDLLNYDAKTNTIYKDAIAALGEQGLIGQINKKVTDEAKPANYDLKNNYSIIGVLKADCYNPTRWFVNKGLTGEQRVSLSGGTTGETSDPKTFTLVEKDNGIFSISSSGGTGTQLHDSTAHSTENGGELETLGKDACRDFIKKCVRAGRQGFAYYIFTTTTIEHDDGTSSEDYDVVVNARVADDYIYNTKTFSFMGVQELNSANYKGPGTAAEMNILNIENYIRNLGVFLEDTNIDTLTSKNSGLNIYGFNTVADITNTDGANRDFNTTIHKFIYSYAEIEKFTSDLENYMSNPQANKKTNLGDEIINSSCIQDTNELLQTGNLFVTTDSTRIADNLKLSNICSNMSQGSQGSESLLYNAAGTMLNDDLIVVVANLPIYAIRLSEISKSASLDILNSREESVFADDTFEISGKKSGTIHIKKQVDIQYIKGFNTDGSLCLEDTGISYLLDENKYMYEGKRLDDSKNSEINSKGYDITQSFMRSPDEGKMILTQYYPCYKEEESEIEGWMPLGRKAFINRINVNIQDDQAVMNYDNPVFLLSDANSNDGYTVQSNNQIKLGTLCDSEGNGNEDMKSMTATLRLSPIYEVH